MKRLKLILSVFTALMAFIAMQSCEQLPWYRKDAVDPIETVQPDPVVDEWSFDTPQFATADAIFAYQKDLQMHRSLDSLFVKMDPLVLTNVISVTLKKHNPCMIADIIYEYTNNKEVYNNLPIPKAPSTPKEIEEVKETPPDINAVDTIINGRKAKIQYYE